jgi:hypothetical protein
MSKGKRAVHRTVNRMTRVIEAAASSRTGLANIARRSNIVIARNVGQPGATQAATSHQQVRIEQTLARTADRTRPMGTRDGKG